MPGLTELKGIPTGSDTVTVDAEFSDYVIEILSMREGEEELGIEPGTLILESIQVHWDEGKLDSDLTIASVVELIEQAIIDWEWQNGDFSPADFAQITADDAGDRAYHASVDDPRAERRTFNEEL